MDTKVLKGGIKKKKKKKWLGELSTKTNYLL